jgi:hypothetical protein
MAMSKKDYQALARAFHTAMQSAEACSDSDHCCGVQKVELAYELVADVLAADSPRFSRALFIEACETGKGLHGISQAASPEEKRRYQKERSK